MNGILQPMLLEATNIGQLFVHLFIVSVPPPKNNVCPNCIGALQKDYFQLGIIKSALFDLVNYLTLY